MSRNGQQRKSPRPKQVQKALARKQEKERVKVAGHIHHLQQLDAGDKNPHIQELKQQVRLLVDGHNEFVTAYNNNVAGYGNALQHLDIRVGALCIVLDDIMRGGLDNVTRYTAIDTNNVADPSVGGVHWAGYMRMYVKKMEEDLAKLKAQQETAQVVPFDPLITPSTSEETEDGNDVVFGGKDENGEDSSGLQTSATG